MKESRKLPENDVSGDVAGKRPRTPVLSDDEEDFLAELSVEEETLTEVMKLLEEEISRPTNPNPSSEMFSSSFVTINGNEESCGPSFSDSASTVMASIDMGNISISYFVGPSEDFSGGSMSFPAPRGNGPWVVEERERDGYSPEVVGVSGQVVNGFNGGESDDEWLARVLSGAPLEFEE